MFTKHEETVMHDLVNLLNEARSMGVVAGEIYTIADMMEEVTYTSDDDERTLTESEAREAVTYINALANTQGRLIEIENAIEWVCDV